MKQMWLSDPLTVRLLALFSLTLLPSEEKVACGRASSRILPCKTNKKKEMKIDPATYIKRQTWAGTHLGPKSLPFLQPLWVGGVKEQCMCGGIPHEWDTWTCFASYLSFHSLILFSSFHTGLKVKLKPKNFKSGGILVFMMPTLSISVAPPVCWTSLYFSWLHSLCCLRFWLCVSRAIFSWFVMYCPDILRHSMITHNFISHVLMFVSGIICAFSLVCSILEI